MVSHQTLRVFVQNLAKRAVTLAKNGVCTILGKTIRVSPREIPKSQSTLTTCKCYLHSVSLMIYSYAFWITVMHNMANKPALLTIQLSIGRVSGRDSRCKCLNKGKSLNSRMVTVPINRAIARFSAFSSITAAIAM